MKYLQILLILFAMHSINVTQAQQRLKPKNSMDTVAGCGCPKLAYVNPGYPYYPGLDHYLNYETFAHMTNWTMAGKEESFKYLFTSGSQISDSRSNFSLLSPRDPIRMTHPQKTFTVNFTPCKNKNGIYELPLTLFFKHQVMDEVRDFEFTKFDHTALAYVTLLLRLAEKRPDEMIRLVLKRQAEQRDNMEGINASIAAINAAYQTGITTATKEKHQDNVLIESIMDSLVAKKLRQTNVLTTAFIVSVPGIHRINSVEYDRLYNFFSPYVRRLPNDIENFEKEIIRPDINLWLDSKNAELEISGKIIHQNRGNQQPAKIFADIKTTDYTSRDGLMIDFNSVCLPHYTTITGTPIAISFNQASLITTQRQNTEQIDYIWFPQLVKPAPGAKSNMTMAAHNKGMQYDALLTEFSGLFVKSATLKIPMGKVMLTVNGANLIINNNLIAGSMIFENTSGKTAEIRLVSGRVKRIQIVDLLSALKKTGLAHTKALVIEKRLVVFFRKN